MYYNLYNQLQMFKKKIPVLKVSLPKKNLLIPKLSKILYSGNIAEGKIVYEFEKNFKKKFKYNNYSALAVSSGTAALHIAFILCGIKKNDEVISSPITAEPTNISILMAGGKGAGLVSDFLGRYADFFGAIFFKLQEINFK